jgi:hypothetical protein
MIHGELPALRAQVRAELGRLARVVEEIADLASATRARAPTQIEIVAASAYLHNYYSAIENCLTRIAHGVDESIPSGPDSHRILVDQLSAPIEGLRPAVLTLDLARRLDEYRRFRHAFRHTYFVDLDWTRVAPLLGGASLLAGDVERALLSLFDALGAGGTGT